MNVTHIEAVVLNSVVNIPKVWQTQIHDGKLFKTAVFIIKQAENQELEKLVMILFFLNFESFNFGKSLLDSHFHYLKQI